MTPPLTDPGPLPTPAAFAERQAERDALVDGWRAAKSVQITCPRVLAAMRRVPRHALLPPALALSAYLDAPLHIGLSQTISQPYIVALMTQMLALRPTDRVLEVGTGSGYQAAVLAEVAAQVFSVEVLPDLHLRATQALRGLGYAPPRLYTALADGYNGWPYPDAAPFDAVIVTASPDHIPPPLLDQLAVGGRLVIPVGAQPDTQQLQQLTRQPDGTFSRSLGLPVLFVPMTGLASRDPT